MTYILILSGDSCKIMRGTWFYDNTWQPMEAGYATQIEAEYLGKFLGHRIKEETECVQKEPKGPKPGNI